MGSCRASISLETATVEAGPPAHILQCRRDGTQTPLASTSPATSEWGRTRTLGDCGTTLASTSPALLNDPALPAGAESMMARTAATRLPPRATGLPTRHREQACCPPLGVSPAAASGTPPATALSCRCCRRRPLARGDKRTQGLGPQPLASCAGLPTRR